MTQPIIDFRVRPPIGGMLNFRFYSAKRSEFYAEKHRFEVSAAAKEESLDLFWQEMSEAGIVAGVMNARQVGPKYGGATNDEVADIQGQFPGKLYGYGTVELHHPGGPDGMAKDIEHAIRGQGLHGISLDPGWSDPPVHADDPPVIEVGRVCGTLGVPLMLTMSGLAGPDTYWCHPQYIDRLAAACPDTSIVVAHGCWPYVQAICAVALARPNVYVSADQGMLHTVGTADYVAAINTFMADQFLFATSFPTGPIKAMVDLYNELPIADFALPKILYENAARLLKIGSPA